MCCLLVLNSVTSTPQWIRQPEAAWGEMRRIHNGLITFQYLAFSHLKVQNPPLNMEQIRPKTECFRQRNPSPYKSIKESDTGVKELLGEFKIIGGVYFSFYRKDLLGSFFFFFTSTRSLTGPARVPGAYADEERELEGSAAECLRGAAGARKWRAALLSAVEDGVFVDVAALALAVV